MSITITTTTTSRRRRIAAAVLAGLCVSLGTTAGAPASPADAQPAPMRLDGQPHPPKIGDTPADLSHPVAVAAKAGDTPVDHPGASRAPDPVPATIEVVRPERTIVRDVDEVLPIVLSGVALLLALGATGYAVVRMRSLQRLVTRSH